MYLHPSVNIDKVLKMLKSLRDVGTELHQFSMYKNGKKILELAPYPYHIDDKRRVNSVSKTFTSTAIGMCYDRGLLNPKDKLISFFPTELTQNADDKIKKLTLHDLLTMTTGVEDVITLLTESEDPLKAFFNHRFKVMPNNFQYNNSASFMLSAVVTQLTGNSMFDFLSMNLFPILNIKDAIWPSLNGITEGCAGLRISADDMARHMQVYLNNGMFNGKRILSEEWINMAKSFHIATDDAPMEWWNKGYGYQIWLNKSDGYRASGALGQYGHVFPDLNIVLGIESRVGQNDATQDIYYDFCSDFGGNSTSSLQELEFYLKNMYLPSGSDVSGFEAFDKIYLLEPNDLGFTAISLCMNGNIVECNFNDGEYMQTMRFGVGHWEENKIFAHHFRPELYYLTRPRKEVVHFNASCEINTQGNMEVMLRFRDCPFSYKMTIVAGENIEIKFDTDYLTPGAACIYGKRILEFKGDKN